MKIAVNTILLICLLASSAFAALKPNDAAPAFSLRESRGNDFYLSDALGAKNKEEVNGVILSFFASWCIPCRNELPIINSLADEMKAKGVKVVIVGVREDFRAINALLTSLKVDKPIVLSDQSGKVSEEYQVRFLPITFFIGSDGKVKQVIYGEIASAQALRTGAEKLFH